MNRETSQTIREWGDATFGEAPDLTALVVRARGEIGLLRQGRQPADHRHARIHQHRFLIRHGVGVKLLVPRMKRIG